MPRLVSFSDARPKSAKVSSVPLFGRLFFSDASMTTGRVAVGERSVVSGCGAWLRATLFLAGRFDGSALVFKPGAGQGGVWV